MQNLGEIAGISTAICWTITAMSFQLASRRIGSVSVNLLRLLLAFAFYVVYTKVVLGTWLPSGFSVKSWTYLSISGLIGFVLGDFFLFKSYEYISSKISMLVMTLAPPIAALMGWFMMKEPFSWLNLTGMVLVLLGVALVILRRETAANKKMVYSVRGVLFAFGGAVGQGVGAVFSKIGMEDHDPFAASQIRVITGVIGFAILITLMKRWKNLRNGLKDTKALKALSVGSFFGPFLGVALSMVAFKNTTVGIASTLMATVPVFILLPSVFYLKEQFHIREIIGAAISVIGIFIFFI